MKVLMALFAVIFLASPSFAGEISEVEVKSFLTSWLTAQNRGDYPGYAGMYATKFKGIKRSGDRTYRYNHEAWLKDRKRMFAHKMTVAADNVRIQVLETGATVEFEQTWESRNYKDKGGKELFLIHENDQLRIAREEMLASKVLAGKGMVLDSTNFPFAFAMPEGIVLPFEAVDADLDKLRFSSSNGIDHVASVPVDTGDLPPSTQSLLGMPVRIYGPKGACEAKINGFKLVSKKIPHFGEIQRWKEEKTPRKKIVRNIFDEGMMHLVATTDKCSGDFAKDARLPLSPVYVGKKADKETARLVTKAFRALPDYARVVKPYVKDGYFESIKTFELDVSGKKQRWVSMFVISGEPYCGGEGGILGGLWRIEDDGTGKKLRFEQYIPDLEYITDLDNDGLPEFLSRDVETRGVPHSFYLIPLQRSGKKPHVFKGSNDYDCPC